MPGLRLSLFIVLTAVIFFATVYSVAYDTYLDTSNPLLTHLPHPLSQTHYYANKGNPLNVYFIKKTWAWASSIFFFTWFTSPEPIRTSRRWAKWAIETATWLLFTTWFFGPSIIERVIVASGGECVLSLPSGDPMIVPTELCLTRSSLSPASHPDIFAQSLSFIPPLDWHSAPRLRRGHDVSGHIFLLTMSSLFLADQLRYSLGVKHRSIWHNIAMSANVIVILCCIFGTYTTSLYFHSPLEKLSGYRESSRSLFTFPFVDE